MKNIKIISTFFLSLLIFSCNSKPKVIEGVPVTGNDPLKEIPTTNSAINAEHKVVVNEKLNTEKYTYLNVSESENTFWIAIPKTEIEVGATYYFTGGLLKKNFLSREFNKTFETLYLVSNISIQPAHSGSAVNEALNKIKTPDVSKPINVNPAEGAIKISELISNKENYEGQLVKITGKCVKVNPKIMGRNWVHIQDGSADDYDMTVTTSQNVPLGAVVTLEGTIALNKDFGAGYRYDIIMEGAILK